MPVIETHGLRKVFRSRRRGEGLVGAMTSLFSTKFDEKVAVDAIDMAVEGGELVGYLGPNGAGKSTTIKMLTGILVPTAGEIRVAGVVPHADRMRNAANIGVVFGQRSQLYWDLPLHYSFTLLRAIYDIPAVRFKENVARFTDILGLDAFMDTPVRQLSLGERMRADFAAALLHDPQIVYLDEPTIGLDVVAKEAIREFIATINRERGTTVVLTTHDLADVERLCRRVILIDDGRIVYDGRLDALRERYGTHRTLVVHLAESAGVIHIEGAENVERRGNTIRVRFDRRAVTAEAMIRRVLETYAIADVAIEEPAIDAIVARIYREGAVA